MFRSILAASIIAAATFSAAGAYAQDDNSVAVSTRDVDFNKPSDVHRLYAHIHAAAQQACSGEVVNDAFTAKREQACEDDAVNNAVAQVNQPQLSHLARRNSNDTQLAMRDRRDEEPRGSN